MEQVNSLRNICEVKIAVVIANHKDIKKQIFFPEFSKCSRSFKEWNLALSCIVDKIFKKFPPDLVNKISKFLITYVAIHMWKWAKFHHLNFDFPFRFFHNFFKVSLFTSKGRINEEKAARELVKESSLSLFMQYKIACHYYLDDIIPVLWQQVRQKRYFKGKLKEQRHSDSVVMWSEYLEEKDKVNPASLLIYATESFLANAFFVSLERENIAGIKYCWREMTPSKRILDRGQYSKLVNSGEKYVSVHDCGWLVKLYAYMDISYYDQLSLSNRFEKVIDILEFFLKELKKEECKDFLFSFNIFHELLYYLLRWPYQHLFLRVVDYLFEVVRDEEELSRYFNGEDFFSIIYNILDLSRDPDFCRTYNYSYLLREFWDRTPSYFRDLIIEVEIGEMDPPDVKPTGTHHQFSMYFLETLVLHSDFTSDDEYVFRSILEHANPKDKIMLFRTKGYYIGPILAINGRFRVLDVFLDILNLEEEIVIGFKTGLRVNVFLKVMQTGNIELAEEYVKFVKPHSIDEFKKEIFSKVFEFPKIMEFILNHLVSVNSVNSVYKWFFPNNEKLEYWKSNIIFDQDFAKFFVKRGHGCSRSLDVFLQFLGYSRGKIQDVKREILLKAMPYIIHKLVEQYAKGNSLGPSLEYRILYLCLNNKVRINEFANFIQTWCQDYVEQKMCLVCLNSNHVYEKKNLLRKNKDVDRKESILYCKLHDIKIMLPEDINKICSSMTGSLIMSMEAKKNSKKTLIESRYLKSHICEGLCNLELNLCDNWEN